MCEIAGYFGPGTDLGLSDRLRDDRPRHGPDDSGTFIDGRPDTPAPEPDRITSEPVRG